MRDWPGESDRLLLGLNSRQAQEVKPSSEKLQLAGAPDRFFRQPLLDSVRFALIMPASF
jgi:hypothetical protein